MVSDYVYRGSELGGAGAYTSLDYGTGGFYAGVWAIEDSTGIEYDLYLGYDTEIAGVAVGIGYTAYEYTYTDDSETEFTLSAGYGPISVSYSDGEDDDVASATDYKVMSLSADVGIFSLTYGDYDSDDNTIDYSWNEISTGKEIGEFSLGVTLGEAEGADYLVLDLSTGIDL